MVFPKCMKDFYMTSNFNFNFNSLSNFTDKILSKFVSTYRTSYSSNHVLLKLIEKWKKSLDDKNIVGAVLIDFSKGFDCIPHDLRLAKLHSYGLSMDAITFTYSKKTGS